jgi:hypothetical protein
MTLASCQVSSLNNNIEAWVKTANPNRASYLAIGQSSAQIAFVQMTANNKSPPNRHAQRCLSVKTATSASGAGSLARKGRATIVSKDRGCCMALEKRKPPWMSTLCLRSSHGGVAFVQWIRGWDKSGRCRRALQLPFSPWPQHLHCRPHHSRPTRQPLRRSNRRLGGIRLR